MVELMVEMAANSNGQYCVRFAEYLDGISFEDQHQVVAKFNGARPIQIPEGWHL